MLLGNLALDCLYCLHDIMLIVLRVGLVFILRSGPHHQWLWQIAVAVAIAIAVAVVMI